MCAPEKRTLFSPQLCKCVLWSAKVTRLTCLYIYIHIFVCVCVCAPATPLPIAFPYFNKKESTERFTLKGYQEGRREE